MDTPSVSPARAVRPRLAWVGLALLAIVLFFPRVPRLPLMDEDEAEYAEVAREMVVSHDWLSPHFNGRPFYHKPPLYYWAVAVADRLAGMNATAARLPSALCALALVLALYGFAAPRLGRRAAIAAALAFATCLQTAVLAHAGVLDMALALLVSLSTFCLFRALRGEAPSRWLLAGAALSGLAVLAKGLLGLLPMVVTGAWWVLSRRREAGKLPFGARALVAAAATFLVVAVPWFVAETWVEGPKFLYIFFVQQHFYRTIHPMQGHSGPVFYYVPVLLIGFFPWALLLAPAVPRAWTALRSPHSEADDLRALCLVWAGFVLLLFSAVKTKLPGYVEPMFPALALLAGDAWAQAWEGNGGRGMRAALAAVVALALALVAITVALPSLVGRAANAHGLASPHAWGPAVGVIAVGWLLCAGAAAWAAARLRAGGQRTADATLGLMAGGMAAVCLAAVFGLAPAVAGSLAVPSQELTVEAVRRAGPGGRVVLFGYRSPAAVYYAGRSLEFARVGDGLEGLLRRLQERRPVLIVARLSQTPPSLLAATRVLDRRPGYALLADAPVPVPAAASHQTAVQP